MNLYYEKHTKTCNFQHEKAAIFLIIPGQKTITPYDILIAKTQAWLNSLLTAGIGLSIYVSLYMCVCLCSFFHSLSLVATVAV